MTKRTVSLWGPVGSGKTMFLMRLCGVGRHVVSNDGQVRYMNAIPQDDNTDAVIRQHHDTTIQTGNRFAAATSDSKGDLGEPLRFKLEFTDSKQDSMTVQVQDRPGGDFERLEDDVLAEMVAADGLVLLLNLLDQERAQTMAGNVNTLLRRLKTRGFHLGGKPLAVCVSKADVLVRTTEDYRTLEEGDFAALFSERIQLERYTEELKDFSCVRFFGVSAVGVRGAPIQGGAVSEDLPIGKVLFRDEQWTPRLSIAEVKPINLADPFAWIWQELSANEQSN